MKYELPPLGYDYGSLEPHIDARTMEIHYTKHHQAYVNNLNAVLEKYPAIAETPLEDLMRGLSNLEMDEADKAKLRNHGGGHLNHTLFWSVMGSEKSVDQKLVEEVTARFGSVDAFRELFSATATNHFGSGWAWLVRDAAGTLQVYSLPNQDSPYLQGHQPVLCLDVWEHAYYLKYQNLRADYVKNWWEVVRVL